MPLKPWALLARPHTAALTMAGTALGAWAGGAAPPDLVLWAAWALLFHAVGFAHNSIHDARHDAADPAKGHFPLVRGDIRLEDARAAWAVGMVAVFGGGAALLAFHGWAAGAIGVGWLVAAMGFGVLYNRTSKRSLLAPLWISLSFAALPAFAFIATAGPPLRDAGLYLFAFGFLMLLHQIAYAGYLKDLGPDPVNLLRRLGATLKPVRPFTEVAVAETYMYAFSPAVQAWGLATRAAAPALAIAWGLTAGTADWPILLALALLLAVAYWTLSLPGFWRRGAKVRLMGACEALTYLILVASLAGALGPLALWFYLGPLAWYFTTNKLLWGKWATPAV